MLAKFSKLFDTLANLGIWIRLNDKRTEPPTEVGREWGAEVDGFVLSLAALRAGSLSLMIKNAGTDEVRVSIPGWLRYLTVAIDAPLRSFGKQVMNDPQLAKPVERVFPAGKAVLTEIPVGSIYELRPGVGYRVRVSCPVPGKADGLVLTSNEVTATSDR
jgi:hypothetical protein